MLEDFLWKHDIDIILLQEVTSTNIDAIRRYTKYINIGTEQRGTVMMVKYGITLTNIRRLPWDEDLHVHSMARVSLTYMRPQGPRKNRKGKHFIIRNSLFYCRIR